MAERARGRQQQQRGWPGQPAPSLPGARATPAKPASGGGCLPQPRWAVCATGAGAHQGQTSCEEEKDIWCTAGTSVEEQGTWASRTQNHSEAGYGRPVDRGAWTAKTVKRPPQQPAHPQYANYWAPLTPKRHIPPHSAQPQHTNYWAPRTRKRHQQEHRPQQLTERSDPTQHAKGRTGDCPGPSKGTSTRQNVTPGGGGGQRVRGGACRVSVGNRFARPLRCWAARVAWGLAAGLAGPLWPLGDFSGTSISRSSPPGHFLRGPFARRIRHSGKSTEPCIQRVSPVRFVPPSHGDGPTLHLGQVHWWSAAEGPSCADPLVGAGRAPPTAPPFSVEPAAVLSAEGPRSSPGCESLGGQLWTAGDEGQVGSGNDIEGVSRGGTRRPGSRPRWGHTCPFSGCLTKC